LNASDDAISILDFFERADFIGFVKKHPFFWSILCSFIYFQTKHKSFKNTATMPFHRIFSRAHKIFKNLEEEKGKISNDIAVTISFCDCL